MDNDDILQDMADAMLGMTKPMTKYLELHNGRPLRDWSGIVQAGKVVRHWINSEHPEHVTTDEAEDKAEDMIRAYLLEQQR